MAIDHIGIIFFPEIVEFRIVGRLAMPLFAFAVARGFFYSHMHGTLGAYKKRMIIFAVLSQVPYMIMMKELTFNIGVLWLVCLLFLERAEKIVKTEKDYAVMYLLVLFSAIVPMDYGLYGLGFTLILYYFEVKNDNGTKLYVSYAVIHALRIMQNIDYGLMQIFTLPCLPIIDILRVYDDKIKIKGRFFYVFYPLHIIILLIIKAIF